MNSMPNRLIFRPKCQAFGGRKQLMKIHGSLQEEEVEWSLISIMLTIGVLEGRRRAVKLDKDRIEKFWSPRW